MDCGLTILIFLAFIQATFGQTVTLDSPPAVEQGRDTVFTCTGGESPYNFIWADLSLNPNVNIFIGGERAHLDEQTKYINFEVSENGNTSIMTIMSTQIADEGLYRCSELSATDESSLKVEVQSTRSLSVEGTLVNNTDMYEATCDAIGGRPNETITWMLGDSGSPCDDIVETYLTAGPGLFSKRSVCTFQADSENYGQTVRCVIGGHQVSDLNGEETSVLNIHNAPTGIVEVDFEFQNPNLIVSCGIAQQPNPPIRNYYILANDTLKHQSSTAGNSVELEESEFDLYTDFICVAGNYLGNITSPTARYDPDRPTTLTPTTESITTEGSTTELREAPAETTSPETKDAGKSTGSPSANVGAIVGGVVGGIVLIIIIVLVIKFLVKPECMGGSGSNSGGSRKKPASSAVGSSNGSEKDKIKPSAAPRTQSSIQHTTDNPEQAEYAMVDRKPGGGGKGGGDMPDKGYGAGQNEPAGMVYADLDLSAKAGHTEKQIPQNKDDVVVYSSILV